MVCKSLFYRNILWTPRWVAIDPQFDDDILFMLSNIIKYMQCTMKHEKETRHNDER